MEKLDCNTPLVANSDFKEIVLSNWGTSIKVRMDKTLITFTQLVDCPTRENNGLDVSQCQESAQMQSHATSGEIRPQPGAPPPSPLVKMQPVNTWEMREWSEETSTTRQVYLETTDWDALYEPLCLKLYQHNSCENCLLLSKQQASRRGRMATRGSWS